MAIFTGNDSDNTINGSNENDTISGLGGKDLLSGGVGNDAIDGGTGDDKLFGGTGNDSVFGGDGNDVLKPYGGTFQPISTSEFDQLTGGNGSDLFDLRDATGSPGYFNDDALDQVPPTGFALITDFQPDLNAGAGDKIQLQGNAAEYRLIPVSWGQKFGKENTQTTTDVALAYVGPEQDKQEIVAVLQDVSAQMISNSDGFLKNTNVFVFDPNYVHPPSTSIPNPPPSINIITGTPGVDNLQGTGGADAILGLGAKDSLTGNAGDDILIGGAGKDRVSGGTGADKFAFVSLRDKGDRITDFNKGEGDKLVFDADGFAALKLGGLKANQFVKGKTALDGKDRLIYDQQKGKLFYDADGIGSSKQVEIATFGNKPALAASDILVVASPF